MSISEERKADISSKLKEMNENTVWLNKEMPGLRKKYPNMFIAIFKKKLVGTDPDHKNLLLQMRKKFGNIDTVLIEFINGEDYYFII